MEILVRGAEQGLDAAALLAAIPYCAHLGITASVEKGAVTLTMPFAQHLIGNPVLPALHGGVIGSLLETAAIVQVLYETREPKLPKPVDTLSIFLRSGRAIASYARARIARQGKRIVNVHAEMWQDDETKLVAALRGHFLIAR